MPGKVFYNKLIRDRIPEKIAAKGSQCETRELREEEFKVELRKKVGEEASALIGELNREELASELADILAVIDEIRKVEDISDEELAMAIATNHQKKGGFEKRLFLEWSSDDGYKSNEQTS